MVPTASKTDEWGVRQALSFLAAVANGDVDVHAMREGIPDFLAAAGGTRAFPVSPILSLEYRALTERNTLEIRDKLFRFLQRLGPSGSVDGPDGSDDRGIQLAGLRFFPGGSAGLLVAGPLKVVMLYQAVRILNEWPSALRRCPAFKPHSKGTERCDRWFASISGHRGPDRQFCSDKCRARAWASNTCTFCGQRLTNNECRYCNRSRRRRG
jgi:hypothetical protein